MSYIAFVDQIAKNTLAIRAAEAPHMKQEPFRLWVFNTLSRPELLIFLCSHIFLGILLYQKYKESDIYV